MRNIGVIFSKEVSAFFNSLIAYLVFIVFLVVVGLFFWIFGENVLMTGLATMDDLFASAPWAFLFVIPAITMRSFSDELKTGTFEMLVTKPITDWQIIIGKFLGACFLVLFALLPTLVFYYSLNYLSIPFGNLDHGPIIGAYIGLFALGCIFASIGILTSLLFDNAIASYLTGVFLCFIFYMAFDFIADLPALSGINNALIKIGIAEHYRSISQGVVDTRDIIYFLTFVTIPLILCKIIFINRRR